MRWRAGLFNLCAVERSSELLGRTDCGAAEPRMYAESQRRVWLLSLVLWELLAGPAAGEHGSGGGRQTCAQAKNRCVGRTGCGMALHNVFFSCAEEMRPPLGQNAVVAAGCAPHCQKALVSLLSVDDGLGSDYLTCDCAGNENCELVKSRLGVCADGVGGALRRLHDERHVVSCSLAKLLCEADTPCGTALRYYEQFCKNLWMAPDAEIKCSRKCNNSLSILYRQTKASKLKTCYCDSDDNSLSQQMCAKMQRGTERHCLLREPSAVKNYYGAAVDESSYPIQTTVAELLWRRTELETSRDAFLSSAFSTAAAGHDGASNYDLLYASLLVGRIAHSWLGESRSTW